MIQIPIQVHNRHLSIAWQKYPTFTEEAINQLVELLDFSFMRYFFLLGQRDEYRNLMSTRLSQNSWIQGERFTKAKIDSLLVEARHIKKNDKYSQGNFSKSFKIIATMEADQFFTLSLESRFSKYCEKSTKEQWLALFPKYAKLIETTYNTQIDIDALTRDESIPKEKIGKLLTQAISFNTHNYHWFAVASTGRFFSSVTNLSKYLRKHLLLDGKKLREIDAVNSQPLLLSLFTSCEEFKQDAGNGEFYEKAAEAFGMTRDEFKTWSYKHIFFTNSEIRGNIKETLDSVYPTLAHDINNIKRQTQLWALLQEEESNIWINTALSTSSRVLTVHDAILCTSEDTDKIVNLLISNFSKNKINHLTLKIGDLQITFKESAPQLK